MADDRITHSIVQAFYIRYEEYRSIGEEETEAILLASQEIRSWLSSGKFGNLSENEAAKAEQALKDTGLYAV